MRLDMSSNKRFTISHYCNTKKQWDVTLHNAMVLVIHEKRLIFFGLMEISETNMNKERHEYLQAGMLDGHESERYLIIILKRTSMEEQTEKCGHHNGSHTSPDWTVHIIAVH